jgi:very-short-patch-repair endonuclease
VNNPTPQQPFKPRKEGTRNIVIGQDISSVKQQLAKEFRRQMTPEEKILWQHLRANRLNNLHFRRQQIIDGFLADFYCHAAALVIEVDGKIHEQQVEYDAERDKVLSARELRLLRIKNEEVTQELDKVLMRIVQACSQET